MTAPVEGAGERAVADFGIAAVRTEAAHDVGGFRAAMAAVDRGRALSAAVDPGVTAPARTSAMQVLARQLDEIGRRRLESEQSSADLAQAWSTGMDAGTLALTMHRQVRAMANYNLGVMWSAKLVGVTAGALRQLATST
ncbi:MAG TPA: hypothetical protein VF446_05170 [Trinickia sp.]